MKAAKSWRARRGVELRRVSEAAIQFQLHLAIDGHNFKMPHAIVADSDDESEEDLLSNNPGSKELTGSRDGRMSMDGGIDGMTDAQSTGSTGMLIYRNDVT